ncbi:GGDEF domain-containing protein [Amycolatopsis sp. PS_44_ISF1]|uniref:GGDEF domain-containing protein n=1 Tax=Amycolatopsis sp. PS_44_ISF1 TaxID=2974917 RepID=UPI0028DF01DE|nr:GGDEF domain-containing protein [Amycolatopsis sp. PS_44_ISF1]MDT8912159.1 GGDEF domain-containing protein [Amycolatopsis sp. PS_44_ISF1]
MTDPGGPCEIHRVRITGTGRWALWRLPNRGLIAFVLLAEAAALAGALGSAWVDPPGRAEVFPTLALIGCVLLHTELSRPVEQLREQFAGTPHISLDTVWTFAAVLLLHPALAALVISVSFLYRWLRGRPTPLFRRVFSAAATVLSGYAAAAALAALTTVPFASATRELTEFGAITLAGAVFLAVNTALMTVAVYFGSPHERLREALASPEEYGLEAATIGLGVLLAWALADWPVALLLVVGITLSLHRNVLVHQLRRQARSDAKTGLLNAAAWHAAAAGELARAARAGRTTSVLMLDLDRFKRVNDRHGHLVGDRYLLAVADTLRTEVRAGDLTGRFGGEEFVVLLPGTAPVHAHAIAERIRGHIAAQTAGLPEPITVSIGLAAAPPATVADVDALLEAADTALYAAKHAGRNRTAGHRQAG